MRLKPLFISLWGSRPSLKTYGAVDPTTQRSMMLHPSVVLMISNAPTLPSIDESHADRLPGKYAKPSDDASADTSSYLIHKGRAVDMIKRCVAIEGLCLSRGWTSQATQAFKIAIGEPNVMCVLIPYRIASSLSRRLLVR